MPITIPTSYSNDELATLMHALLAEVATDLGLTDPDSYEQAVISVALALEVDDVADVTDIAKLTAFAREAAWQRALTAAATMYDVADGTQSLKRSQMLTNITKALAEAQAVTSTYAESVGAGYEVGVLKVTRTDDPYIQLDDSVRVP